MIERTCAAIALALGACAAPAPGPARTAQPESLRSELPPPPPARAEVGGPDAAVQGRSVRRIDLRWALDRALAHGFDLALAEAELDAARGRSRSSQGGLFPWLEAGGGLWSDPDESGPFLAFDPYDPQVSLVYRANPGETLHRALGAGRNRDAAELGVRDTRQRVLYAVATLYTNLVFARAAVHVTERVVEDGNRFVGIARARETAGIGSGSDVARAEAKLAADREAVVRAGTAWHHASVRLAVVLRSDPEVLLAPAETVVRAHAIAARSDSTSQRRPDLEAARARADAARHEADAAWWALLGPDVAAELRHTWARVLDDPDPRFDAGVLLRWTLRFEEVGGVGEAAAKRRAADLRVQAMEDRVRAEVAEARESLRAATLRIPLAQEALDAAQRSLRLSDARYQAGLALAIEVLEAEDVVARSRLGLVASILDYDRAQVDLLVATGTISREALLPFGEPAPAVADTPGAGR